MYSAFMYIKRSSSMSRFHNRKPNWKLLENHRVTAKYVCTVLRNISEFVQKLVFGLNSVNIWKFPIRFSALKSTLHLRYIKEYYFLHLHFYCYKSTILHIEKLKVLKKLEVFCKHVLSEDNHSHWAPPYWIITIEFFSLNITELKIYLQKLSIKSLRFNFIKNKKSSFLPNNSIFICYDLTIQQFYFFHVTQDSIKFCYCILVDCYNFL